MRHAIVSVLLLTAPGVAFADCVYTGAKRAYLECIYNEALAAMSQATTTAADVLGLDSRVGSLETEVSFLDASVLSLSDAVTSLSTALDSLTTLVSGINTDLAAAESDIAQLDADIAALSGSTGVLPVGSIVAWHKSFANTPALPTGWAECNGQTVTDGASPYNGQALPNLNGEGRFLRGSATSGTTQSATRVATSMETNSNAYYFNASGANMSTYNSDFDSTDGLPANSRGFINKSGTDNTPGQAYGGRVRPTNMSVVWIMRVK